MRPFLIICHVTIHDVILSSPVHIPNNHTLYSCPLPHFPYMYHETNTCHFTPNPRQSKAIASIMTTTTHHHNHCISYHHNTTICPSPSQEWHRWAILVVLHYYPALCQLFYFRCAPLHSTTLHVSAFNRACQNTHTNMDDSFQTVHDFPRMPTPSSIISVGTTPSNHHEPHHKMETHTHWKSTRSKTRVHLIALLSTMNIVMRLSAWNNIAWRYAKPSRKSSQRYVVTWYTLAQACSINDMKRFPERLDLCQTFISCETMLTCTAHNQLTFRLLECFIYQLWWFPGAVTWRTERSVSEEARTNTDNSTVQWCLKSIS